jgi:hypothetical protein
MKPRIYSDEERVERAKQYNLKFKTNNPEYFKEKARAHYKANKEKISAQRKALRDKKKNEKKTGAANNKKLREVV